MTCPACSNTMAMIFPAGENNVHYCDRCGTIIVLHLGAQIARYVPKLVERCRKFAAELTCSEMDYWFRFGIAESINTPENR